MNISQIAFTFDFIGKLLVTVMAILIQKKIREEKGIDKKVLREMRIEYSVGIVAVIFLTIGYILHVVY